jgi:hypothetical protein
MSNSRNGKKKGIGIRFISRNSKSRRMRRASPMKISDKELQDIQKRLSYVQDNNLFDSHYINDMKSLLSTIEGLKREAERLKEIMRKAIETMEIENPDMTTNNKNKRALLMLSKAIQGSEFHD